MLYVLSAELWRRGSDIRMRRAKKKRRKQKRLNAELFAVRIVHLPLLQPFQDRRDCLRCEAKNLYSWHHRRLATSHAKSTCDPLLYFPYSFLLEILACVDISTVMKEGSKMIRNEENILCNPDQSK